MWTGLNTYFWPRVVNFRRQVGKFRMTASQWRWGQIWIFCLFFFSFHLFFIPAITFSRSLSCVSITKSPVQTSLIVFSLIFSPLVFVGPPLSDFLKSLTHFFGRGFYSPIEQDRQSEVLKTTWNLVRRTNEHKLRSWLKCAFFWVFLGSISVRSCVCWFLH